MKRAVSAIVRAKDTGRIALVRRRDPPREGQWSLPGGSIERDETARDAIIRELREELGLALASEASLGNEIAEARVSHPPHAFVISVRMCEVEREHLLTPASDATAATWAAPSSLRAMGVAEDTAAIIERALHENAS